MSNKSRITPYESQISQAAVGNLFRWLCETTEGERRAVQKIKTELKRQRLQNIPSTCLDSCSEKPQITTLNLHLRNMDSLVSSAERLGFTLVKPSVSISERPQIMLSKPSGERMIIEQNVKSHISIHTAKAQIAQSLVKQHTLDRTMEHLKIKGMQTQMTMLPNGEVQILAKSQRIGKTDSLTEVKTQIHIDGTLSVDIEKTRGKRCVEIVNEVAQAVGGQVSAMQKKDSYFQLPGEPAKTKVNI